jgi:hypothetical protein
MFAYAFPPFRFLSQVLQKVARESCKLIRIAPAWPKQAWFTDLLRLSCTRPLLLPLRVNLLSQLKGRIMHPNPENLHLHAWLLSGRESDRKVFSIRATNHISKAVRQSTEIVYDAVVNLR